MGDCSAPSGNDSKQQVCKNNNGDLNQTTADMGTRSDEAIFPETSLWGSDILYRRLDQADLVEALKVTRRKNGSVCYLYRENTFGNDTLYPASWHTKIECIDRSGSVDFDYASHEQSVIKDFTIDDDNNIIIAELIDAEREHHLLKYFLKLTRFGEDGLETHQVILQDSPGDEELLTYLPNSESNDFEVMTLDALVYDGKPILADTAEVNLNWNNGQLYLLAYTYGIKIYSLEDDFSIVWDRQIMPANGGLWFVSTRTKSRFSVDKNDNMYVQFDVSTQAGMIESRIYTEHFLRDLNKEHSRENNLIVVAIDSAGQLLGDFYVGSDNDVEDIYGMVADNSRLWFVGNRSIEKTTEHNNKYEIDIVIFSSSPLDGKTLSYQLVDFEEDDFAFDFQLDNQGNFFVGGMVGGKYVDSGSQVVNGKGAILKLNKSRELTHSIVMAQPRNVEIQSIEILDSKHVLFAGIYDGPITHTCDNDKSLCYRKGVVGIVEMAP